MADCNASFASGGLDGTIMIWKRYGHKSWGRFQFIGHSGQINGILELTDSRHDPVKRLLSCSNDWTLRIWDRARQSCLHVLSGHKDWVTCMALLPDGRIVSGAMDKSISVWS